jgi:hypothetical protein
MASQQEIKILFLEEFVRRMIINSLQIKPKMEKGESLLNVLEEASKLPPSIRIEKKIEPEIKKAEMKKENIEPVRQLSTQQPKVISEASAPVAATRAAAQIAPASLAPKIPILDKLRPILNDPAVFGVSCSGPDQNIQITRSGMIQTVQMSFTMNEINDFMKDLSEKTKIPLIPGLFKIMLQNLIITAAVSEFVGTKFTIEKKPFQPAAPVMPVRAQFR